LYFTFVINLLLNVISQRTNRNVLQIWYFLNLMWIL